MQLGDLFAKLGQGQTLTPGEIEALRLEGNNVQITSSLVKSWSDNAGGISAGAGHFRTLSCDIGPHDIIGVRLQGDQTLTTGVEANVAFDAMGARGGYRLNWSADSPSQISLRDVPAKWCIRVSGSAVFATNSTGYRYVVLATYNALGALERGTTMATIPAASGVQTTVPFATGLAGSPGDLPITTFKLRVGQNSGGDLVLEACQLYVELIGSEYLG